MKSQQINNINEALLVLRHFIDLSAKLLPFLDELQQKKDLTLHEIQNRNKIIDVYESYSFDTRTSKLLLNSNVLDLIKESFENISQPHLTTKDTRKKSRVLRRFLKEHRRLQEDWYMISAN